jgi:hypothetical protein
MPGNTSTSIAMICKNIFFYAKTDVAGKCRTQYKLKQEGWKTVAIVKSKDISTCLNRHGFDTSMGSILYEVPSVSVKWCKAFLTCKLHFL